MSEEWDWKNDKFAVVTNWRNLIAIYLFGVVCGMMVLEVFYK